METFVYIALTCWYVFCGFSFARAIHDDVTIFNQYAPFGLSVLFWGILMPIDGLFNKG